MRLFENRQRVLRAALRPTLAAVVLLVPATARSQPATPFRLIVNSANSVTEMSRGDVAQSYLGVRHVWPNGEVVVPLDQSTNSPVRAAFSRDVLRVTVEGVQTHWMRAIMAGRGRPPFVASEAVILERVAKDAHLLSYVASDGPLPPGVKTIALRD